MVQYAWVNGNSVVYPRSVCLLLVVREVDVGPELEVLEGPFSSPCSTEQTWEIMELKEKQTLKQLILD